VAKRTKWNDGKWTEGRFKSFITSTLRSGTRRWPPKHMVLADAKTERKINPATGRLAQMYLCQHCKQEFSSRDIQVNHRLPVVSLEGFVSWDVFIERLYCEADELEVLCKPCHYITTQKENTLRKAFHSEQERATYQCWLDMKGRCFNKNSQRFYTHGARGISVESLWEKSYDAFLLDMGLKPPGLTLERKDNDASYSKDNCKWATPKEQANNRRTNVVVSFEGKSQTVQQWAEELNLSFASLQKRLRKWPIEKALSPTRHHNQVCASTLKQIVVEEYNNTNVTQATLAKKHAVSQGAVSKWIIESKNENQHSD